MINSVSKARDRQSVHTVTTGEVTEELLTRLVFKFARSLGAMRSTTQALLNGGAEDREFSRELLSDMDIEMRELQRLIDNVVQFRALDKGTFRLQSRQILPSMLLWRVVDAWRDSIAGKRLVWHIDVPDELEPMLADVEKVQQIIDNLLANILRDSPGGSMVVVSARSLESTLELRFETDTSRLADEEYARIFDLFYTGLQQGRFPTGTGLGLYVARALADAHGGTLELVRPQENRGMMVWVLRLPLAGPVAPIR